MKYITSALVIVALFNSQATTNAIQLSAELSEVLIKEVAKKETAKDTKKVEKKAEAKAEKVEEEELVGAEQLHPNSKVVHLMDLVKQQRT